MLVGPKNVFGPDPTPKMAPKGLKRSKKAPNGSKFKIEDGAVIPKSELTFYISKSLKTF